MIEIEQNKPHKNRVGTQVNNFLLHLMALVVLLLNNMDIDKEPVLV